MSQLSVELYLSEEPKEVPFDNRWPMHCLGSMAEADSYLLDLCIFQVFSSAIAMLQPKMKRSVKNAEKSVSQSLSDALTKSLS